MGTITITAAGFAAPSATPPFNWPPHIPWPGNGTAAPNGTKTATITDAEMLQLLSWIGGIYVQPGTAPTISQLLLIWVTAFYNATKAGVQVHGTIPAQAPPPINLN